MKLSTIIFSENFGNNKNNDSNKILNKKYADFITKQLKKSLKLNGGDVTEIKYVSQKKMTALQILTAT